jgi:hypothetical protein
LKEEKKWKNNNNYSQPNWRVRNKMIFYFLKEKIGSTGIRLLDFIMGCYKTRIFRLLLVWINFLILIRLILMMRAQTYKWSRLSWILHVDYFCDEFYKLIWLQNIILSFRNRLIINRMLLRSVIIHLRCMFIFKIKVIINCFHNS